MSMFKWEVVDPAPGQPVGPGQRLGWGRTVGLGAQHVVAMFGATFVFPLVMGLDANLAIMFSGICTILFLVICNNKVPSYLGTSASFVASVAAIRGQGGDSADVTGAIMVAGIALLLVGVLVHFAGAGMIHKILPPAVTGAVVMLIGFNLAPVVAQIYWPQDQWVALLTAAFMVFAAVLFPGFWSRIAVFLALIFGYLLSWVFDAVFGQIHSITGSSNGELLDHDRVSWAGVKAADWIGFPSGDLADGVSVVHGPSFSLTFVLLVLPGVIALIAENTGHVKAVAEMTGETSTPTWAAPSARTASPPPWPAPSAARPPRRTPRTSASWAPPGSTPPRRTTSRRWWPSCSVSARSSAPSSAPPRAACSAGSPSSCTA